MDMSDEFRADIELIRQAKDGDVVPVSKEFVEAGCPMSVEIKPGPELDQAVAEAIGLKTGIREGHRVLITPREWDEIRGIEHPTCEGDVACIPFQPSTDLGDAFAAAEKVGLFAFGLNDNDGSRFLDRVVDGGVELWRVCQHKYDQLDYVRISPIASAPTPNRAICAAILKLKEQSGD
jgi:hypothetical protein